MSHSDPTGDDAPDRSATSAADELALRDRELEALRAALDAERADAETARAALEAQLRDAKRAAERRAQLEQALAEQREARTRLLQAHDASEARAASTAAQLASAQDAQSAMAAERDAARVESAEAQIILAATEHRVGTLQQEAAQRDASLQALRAEAAAEAAELGAALLAARDATEGAAAESAALQARLDERDGVVEALAADVRGLQEAVAAAEASAQAALSEYERTLQRSRALDAGLETAAGEIVGLRAALAEAAQLQSTLQEALDGAGTALAAGQETWAAERVLLEQLCGESDATAVRWREQCELDAMVHADERSAIAAEMDEVSADLVALRVSAQGIAAELVAAQAHAAALLEERDEAHAAQAAMAQRLADARIAHLSLEEERDALRVAAAEASGRHQSALDDLDAERLAARSDSARLRTELSERDAAATSLQTQLTELCAQHDAARAAATASNARLASESEALAERLAAIGGERDSLQGRCDALSTAVAEATAERDALSTAVAEATAERDALREAATASIAAAEREIAALGETCTHLQAELAQRALAAETLAEERETLQAALLEAQTTARQELSARAAAHESVSARAAALQDECGTLQRAVAETNAALSAARSGLDERQAQCDRLQDALAQHEEALASAQAESEEQRGVLASAQAEATAQREAIAAAARAAEAAETAWQAERADLQATAERLTASVDGLQGELDARRAAQDALHAQLAASQDLGTTLAATEAALEERAVAVERLASEVAQQHSALAALREERDVLGETAARAEAAACAAQAALQERMAASDLLAAERDGLRGERDALTAALSEAAAALEASALGQREFDALATAAEQLREDVIARDASLSRLSVERDGLEAQRSELAARLASTEQGAAQQLRAAEHATAELQASQAALAEHAAAIEALHVAAATSHDEHSAAADAAQQRLNETFAERDALRAQAGSLSEALTEAVERQRRLEGDQQTLVERCTALAGRLSDSEQTRRSLDATAVEAKQVAAELRVELSGAQDRAAELGAALEQALADLATAVQRQTAEQADAAQWRDSAADAQRAVDAAAIELEDLRGRLTAIEADRLSLVEEAVAAADAFAARERDLQDALAARSADLDVSRALLQEIPSTEALAEERDAAAAAQAVLQQEIDTARRALDEAHEAHEVERSAHLAVAEALAAARADLEQWAQVGERLADSDAARAALLAERDELAQQLTVRIGEHDELLERAARLEHGMLAARETEQRLVADAQDRASTLALAHNELARLQAARDRLSAELELAQQQLEARRVTSEQLETRALSLERECAQAHERQQRISEQALDLQQQLLDDEGRLATMALERDQAVSLRATLEEALAEERAQHAASIAEAAEVRAAEETQRRQQASVEAAERQHGELTRLQSRLEELERQQSDAAQRHSQAVSLYMLELNQRSDSLRQRDLEVQRLEEQMRLLELACEDGTEQLAALRNERDGLQAQLSAVASTAALPNPRRATEPLTLTGQPGPSADELIEALQLAEAPRPLRIETPRPEAPAADLRLVDKTPAPSADAARSVSRPSLIVHVEDHAALQQALRVEVERCSGLHYAAAAEIGEDGHGHQPLLAVNLLAKEVDPLATICDPRWGRGEPRAFTYLAAGSRGVIAGMVDFMPHPFAPDECATRLLERPGGTQRLLMVSDKIEVMNEIRAVLNRVRCSTSLALDGRQAFDLVGMVKPDAILVDLTLPRGEGLRLVGRLRADPKTAGIAIIFALGEALDVGRFRADAARVLADSRFSPDDLSGAFSQVLTEWRSGSDELRAAG